MKRILLITGLIIAAGITMAAIRIGATKTLVCSAGSCTLVDNYDADNLLYRTDLTWTASTGGVVTAAIPVLHGIVMRVVTNPNDGTTSPTASYDITITDLDGLDILKTLGGNRSQSASEEFTPFCTDGTNYIPISVLGACTLNIANAGTSTGGKIRLYLKR